MKRILKIVGIFILAVVLLLVAAPFLFKDKLEGILKNTINAQVNADVSWTDLDVSLFRNFPNATVSITNYQIINKAPFPGDTLAAGDHLRIEMGIKQLFKATGDDPIVIDALALDRPRIFIQIDALGNANYTIAKSTDTSDASAKKGTASNTFSFDMQKYTLDNATIQYLDASTGTFLRLKEFNHSGKGDLGASQSTLQTQTTTIASFDSDNVNYLNEHSIDLQADIALDLEQQKYTFLDNKLLINALPLAFDGFVQIIEEGTTIDLSFETPTSDFKNFLAVIPKTYATNLDGVETGGDFRVSGKVKGNATETSIPTLDIAIVSNNASFKYPDLPKRMNNINIDAKIKNDSGRAEDTYININALNFKIDDDLFSVHGKLQNLTTNMLVNLAIKGTLDLANIEKVYPMDLEHPLQGRLTTDMSSHFDMNAIDQQRYEDIISTGDATLTSFQYTGDQLPKPITISNASVSFAPERIQLNAFSGQSGTTDISATGAMENLIPFLMRKEDLKGRFAVKSKVFNLNDFTVDDATVAGTTKTSNEGATHSQTGVQIPDFLDAVLDFNADKVIYDDIELTAVQGSVSILDEQANLTNVSSDIYGGNAGFTGTVSTRSGIPIFNMMLDLNEIDIDQSFSKLDLLKGLAPVAKALQGALNTKINITGQLDENYSPILSSVNGDAFAQLLTAEINTDASPLLTELDSKLSFINLKDIDLSALKTNLQFKDGAVVVQPFTIKVKDINVEVSGGHTFENIMNYQLKLDLPAKYLGSEASNLLATLSDTEKENLFVDLPISLSGNFAKPNIKINTKAAIGSLTTQIVDIQKKRLQNDLEDKIDDVLGDTVGDVLGDILGGNKPKDSTATSSGSGTPGIDAPKTDEVIKDVATGILDGLFGKKKETKKDSIGN
ncbi:MAG: hypothetical protein ACI828_002464 [Flavobacteriales bacterium]|jgi:hypothetical protein